jgi:transcriptional regulator with GAF, ATPase, and Fis domain
MSTILLLQDGEPKARFSLYQKTAIGRSSGCELQILNPGLSRTHAVIKKNEEGWQIEDSGSHNGTFVNGVRIAEPLLLNDGDAVQLGTVSFVFNPPLEVLHDPTGDKTVCIVGGADGQGAEAVSQSEDCPPPEPAATAAILRIACDLAAELDIDRLLPMMLKRFMAHFSADRGYILTRDKSGALTPRAVVSDKTTAALSRTLIDRTFSTKKPLLFHNAIDNVSFVGARSIMELRLCSVMTVPLFSNTGPIGIIQLDSRKPGAFTQSSLAEFALAAEPAARAVENALRFEIEVRKNHIGPSATGVAAGILTKDPAMMNLLEVATRAAESSARVLIEGESGTGKELIARMIHQQGPRSSMPFVAVNCGAMMETVLESELFGHEKGAFTGAIKKRRGCFESADGGTLFLDEVAELSPSTQVKLLRVLQEGVFFPVGSERPMRVDVRVISATNRDLKKMVEEGRFREDLYFRLKVLELLIPPLRQRKCDLEMLVTSFIERFTKAMSKPAPKLSSQALKALLDYSWPGNVRELQNNAERLAVLVTGPKIELTDLPFEIACGAASYNLSPEGNLKTIIDETERRVIVQTLKETHGKKAEACRRLGISRPTLDKKIEDHRIVITTSLE